MPNLQPNALGNLPALLLAEPGETASALSDWLNQAGDKLPALLHRHGALLFRGFEIGGAAAFEAICRAGTPNLVDYTGGGSPRTHVAGKVYTSTEYAADQHIPLHCEFTYFPNPPRFIWFLCEQPADTGGQTPIGDMGRVLEQLKPELVARFEAEGIRYIFNLHGGNGFGRGWHEAFGTHDEAVVERWLNANRAHYRWESDGTLHVDLQGPALRVHAGTGATIWGNQAVNWHVAAHGEQLAERMRRVYRDDEHLPKHATFGDGSPIPDTDVRHILNVLSQQEHAFPWQRGDVLLCDNHRIAHGRRPFTGGRRVLVALAS